MRTPPPLFQIARMPAVGRPPVRANLFRETAPLLALLVPVVARRAKALDVAIIKEPRPLASVRFDMIANGGDGDAAFRLAHAAQRLLG